MIKTFADKTTEKLFETGKSKALPPAIIERAIRRLTQLDNAAAEEDMRMPPSNHLETLSGGRDGQWSVKINDQWRLCFRFSNGDAYHVEIVDYH